MLKDGTKFIPTAGLFEPKVSPAKVEIVRGQGMKILRNAPTARRMPAQLRCTPRGRVSTHDAGALLAFVVGALWAPDPQCTIGTATGGPISWTRP